MKQPTITVTISGISYHLCASDTESMGKIPRADRQSLISLLESLKQQEALGQSVGRRAPEEAKTFPQTPLNSPETGSSYGDQVIKPERLGSGDVDALMARLVMEEKNQQKTGITKQGIYKVVAGLAVAIILFVLIL